MTILKKIIWVSLSIILLVGCDYTSKKVANNELKNLSSVSYLGGNLRFTYTENSGGMLSFGSTLSETMKLAIFKYFVTLLLLLLFIYTIINKNIRKKTIIAFIFILSGGIGNLIDRFTNDGKVVDFIILGIADYRTGIFNLADVYVTVGVILVVISNVLNKYRAAQKIT
jgi:signal peptidase II